MVSSETRAVLLAVIQHLKTQVVYTRNLHESYLVLCDALALDYPQLQTNLQAEMEKIRVVPEVQWHLDELDSLLEQVAKIQ